MTFLELSSYFVPTNRDLAQRDSAGQARIDEELIKKLHKMTVFKILPAEKYGTYRKTLLLSDRQLKIIEYIQQTGFLQNQAFEMLFPMVSEDTILNELKPLLANGIIRKQGVTKGAKYVIL